MVKKSDAKAGAVPAIDAGATPTPIEYAGALTIVLVATSAECNGEEAVALPEGATAGDGVEIYVRGYPVLVYPPEGERFDGDLPSVQCASGLFRKIDDASWRFILGN